MHPHPAQSGLACVLRIPLGYRIFPYVHCSLVCTEGYESECHRCARSVAFGKSGTQPACKL